MAWIEVHQSLLTHRKTLRLCRLLKMDKFSVTGRLMALWCWALDNAQDGFIHTGDSDLLADVMGWDEPTRELIAALQVAGFIDMVEEGYQIHDWNDYAGKLIDRRERNKLSMRVAREREKAERVVHVDATSETRDDTCKATVPNPTQPNSTQPYNGEISYKAREYASAALAATRPPSQKIAKTRPQKPQKRENIPRRNPLWDALEAAFNFHPAMPSEKSHLGKIVRELQEAGATPEEIPLRIARYCKRYGRDYLTLDALHKHWSEFATEPVVTNGGQLDAVSKANLAASREDEKRRLFEEAMRLADGEAGLDGELPRPKVTSG